MIKMFFCRALSEAQWELSATKTGMVLAFGDIPWTNLTLDYFRPEVNKGMTWVFFDPNQPKTDFWSCVGESRKVILVIAEKCCRFKIAVRNNLLESWMRIKGKLSCLEKKCARWGEV